MMRLACLVVESDATVRAHGVVACSHPEPDAQGSSVPVASSRNVDARDAAAAGAVVWAVRGESGQAVQTAAQVVQTGRRGEG